MDPPFPPPDTAPPAPPADPDQDQEYSSSAEPVSPEAAEKFSLMEAGENGHSMPNLEEARTEGAIAVGGAYNKSSNFGFLHGKRGLLLAALTLGALTLIVAFSVAISSNRKDLSSALEPEDPSLANMRDVSRLQDVQQFLAVRVSELSLLEQLDSPQYKAALWIADQDELNVPLPSDPTNYSTSFDFVQRYIMAVFYFALDGPNWTKKMEFLSGKSVCEWQHILDPSVTPANEKADNWQFGISCADGVITHIFICTLVSRHCNTF